MSLHVLKEGAMCGPYEIERELGRGGMAIVYLARGPEGERRAIKTLQFNAALDPDQVDRFKREISLLANLDEVHVVRFYEAGKLKAGRGGSTMWVALEYLEGQTLRQIIDERGGRVAPEDIARWGKHVADGVIAAHALGVIHRDLKPANVAIVNGMAKVFDFGIAKFRKWGIKATNFRTRLGTIGYMPPEQLSGREVDERTDVFALGVILYELATGKHPILPRGVALTPPEAIARCFTIAPTPIHQLVPGFPEDLSNIVQQAMAKSPQERFPSMIAMRDALDAALKRHRVQRQPLVMGQISGGFPAVAGQAAVQMAEDVELQSMDETVPLMGALDIDEPEPVGATLAIAAPLVDAPEAPTTRIDRRQPSPTPRPQTPLPTPALAAPMVPAPPPRAADPPKVSWAARLGVALLGALVGMLLGLGVLVVTRQMDASAMPSQANPPFSLARHGGSLGTWVNWR